MNTRLAMPFLCVLLASCAVTEQSGFIKVSSQPANVGDAGTAARAYHDSGAYQRDLQIVANQAARWIKARAASAQRPALVLDIDETALSNWEIIKRDDFGRPIAGPADLASAGPWGWAAWDQLARDPAIELTLQGSELLARLTSPSFSLPVARKISGLPPNAIFAPLATPIIRASLWCLTEPISLPRWISKRLSG